MVKIVQCLVLPALLVRKVQWVLLVRQAQPPPSLALPVLRVRKVKLVLSAQQEQTALFPVPQVTLVQLVRKASKVR
jgi:hypothetical protein